VKKVENREIILDNLNKSLRLEYSLIIYYPLINMRIRDIQIKKMVTTLGTMSIKHADTVADAITSLGGTPQWEFDPAPEDIDLKKIFLVQLEKERLALKLHTETSQLITDKSMRAKFEGIAKQEEGHIIIVENILALLDQGKS
jgi:bacterioferritin (cytochrome b1)